MSKYIIFSALFVPNIGGVERYTYNLAKSLIEKKHDVVVITSNASKLKYENMEKIKIYRLPTLFFLDGRLPILLPSKYLKKVLGNLKADYVIINSRFYTHSLCGIRFSEKNHIPYIIIEHGSGHLTLNNCFIDKILHYYDHKITNYVKKHCLNFYGVSHACNKWLLHFGIEAKGTVYNAINNNEIQEIIAKSNEDVRSKLGLTSTSIIITFSGRLISQKGVMKLIDAIELLKTEIGNICLVIVGNGKLFNKIKKKENSYIKVLGQQKFEDIIVLLSQSDIFCLPTEYPEGLPTSVLEAAAAKCFIITSNFGGSSELLIDNKHGVITQSDPEEISKSIYDVINNPSYRLEATGLTYKRLLRMFTWESTSEKIEKIFTREYF